VPQHQTGREIQTGLWLVQDQEIRIMQQRRDEEDLLPRAFGIAADRLIGGGS
jgi:hypothetical protein